MLEYVHAQYSPVAGPIHSDRVTRVRFRQKKEECRTGVGIGHFLYRSDWRIRAQYPFRVHDSWHHKQSKLIGQLYLSVNHHHSLKTFELAETFEHLNYSADANMNLP